MLLNARRRRRPKPANNRRRATTTKKSVRKLLPVLRPSQNMRDIIKQLALLEDHLYQPQKRCADCIRKHFLTIEGLAEECATLCKPRAILPEARKVATTARVLHHAWEARNKDPSLAEHVAGRLRRLRKGLMRTFASLPVNKLPTAETKAVAAILSGNSSSNGKPKLRRPRSVRSARA